MTEDELLLAIRNRTHANACLLYDHYCPTLYKVVYCTLKNKELTDELMPQVFTNIWNSIENYDHKNNRLVIWMAGMARLVATEKLNTISSFGAISKKKLETIYKSDTDTQLAFSNL